MSVSNSTESPTSLLPRECFPWEKGADCGWNVKTARIVLLPFQLLFLLLAIHTGLKITKMNGRWGTSNRFLHFPCTDDIELVYILVARPVLCMILVTVSMFFDILE